MPASDFELALEHHRFAVISLTGTEAIDKLFFFTISFDCSLSFSHEILEKNAQLIFYEKKQIVRFVNGVIYRVERKSRQDSEIIRYQIVLTSRLALAQYHGEAQVFVDSKPQLVITKLLNDLHFSQSQIHWRVTTQHSIQPYIVQLPQESNFDFLMRIMKRHNIHYQLLSDEHYENLYFYDDLTQLRHYQPISLSLIENTTLAPQSLIGVVASKKSVSRITPGNELELRTNSKKIFPGCRITLDNNHLQNNDYLVRQIEHQSFSLLNLEQSQQTIPYQNQLTAIDDAISLALKSPSSCRFPLFFTAKIVNQQLDHIFKSIAQRISLHNIPLLTPYAGPAKKFRAGFVFPIYDDSHVVLTTLDHDPEKIVLLGCLAEHAQVPVINEKNRYQHIFRSQQHNQFLVDDRFDQSAIELSSRDNKVKLTRQSLQIETPKGTITICSQGEMKYHCAGDFLVQSNSHFHQRAQLNFTQQVTESYVVTSKKSLSCYGASIQIRTQQKTFLSSDKTLDLHCEDKLLLACKTGELTVNAQHGCDLLAGNHLEIRVNQGSLQLRCGPTQIVMSNQEIEMISATVDFTKIAQMEVQGRLEIAH